MRASAGVAGRLALVGLALSVVSGIGLAAAGGSPGLAAGDALVVFGLPWFAAAGLGRVVSGRRLQRWLPCTLVAAVAWFVLLAFIGLAHSE